MPMQTRSILLRLALLAFMVSFLPIRGNAQSDSPEASSETLITASHEDIESMNEEINWAEETKKGGMTMVALFILSCAGVAFVVERAWDLRVNRFAPRDLAEQADKCAQAGDYDAVLDLCEENSSTLAKAISFMVRHRDKPYDAVTQAVADIAGRDIRNQHTRTAPLAVIASLAPLLGLLGTMIGMIESFKLVSLYGDDGGASMLAGSIAKALITTAVGLIIAIPALIAHHFFKQRIAVITMAIENGVEPLMESVVLEKQSPAGDALDAN